MVRHFLSAAAAVGITFSAVSAMALTVTVTNSADTLAGTVLGSGIVIQNATYTGGAMASGTFTGGGNIGIDTGILLTTGKAVIAQQANNTESATWINGLAGDPDLDALVPGYSTHDASVLAFDFSTQSGDLFFQYVFASEEYTEYSNTSFNDVFGFFVDGVNIALVPGTSLPVSINEVNQVDNTAYYVNNEPGSNAVATQYDGLTTVLTASVLGLGAGSHHMKIAIGDAGDFSLDSGVFIKSGSFSSTNPADPTPGIPELSANSAFSSLALLAMGAFILAGRRRRSA